MMLGFPNGGKEVITKGNDDAVTNIQSHYGQSDLKKIPLSLLEQCILSTKRGGDNFKYDFVLHVLTTLLCSTFSSDASPKILHSLIDANKVKEFNLAQYIFKCIQKAILPKGKRGR